MIDTELYILLEIRGSFILISSPSRQQKSGDHCTSLISLRAALHHQANERNEGLLRLNSNNRPGFICRCRSHFVVIWTWNQTSPDLRSRLIYQLGHLGQIMSFLKSHFLHLKWVLNRFTFWEWKKKIMAYCHHFWLRANTHLILAVSSCIINNIIAAFIICKNIVRKQRNKRWFIQRASELFECKNWGIWM